MNATEFAFHELRRFLRALYGPYDGIKGAHVEVRTFRPAYAVGEGENPAGPRGWYPLDDDGFIEAAANAIVWRDCHDVYFGVLPRRRGGGKATDVRVAASIWADIDAGDQTARDAADLLVAAVRNKGLPAPHLLVKSGGGLHGYWRLAEVEKCATREEQDRVRDVMVRLVKLIGGELAHAHACPRANDTARVLRLPGTFNRKINGHPRPVQLLRVDDSTPAHTLLWWEAFLPAIPLPPPYTPPQGSRSSDAWKNRRYPGDGQRRYPGEGTREYGLLPATLQKLSSAAPNGAKHYTMVEVATAARKQGLDTPDVRAAAAQVAVLSGVNLGDPYQIRHLDGIVAWVMRYVQPDPI